MTTTQPVQDPRPFFARALDQTERQIAAVDAAELDSRTPCAEYDVRALLGHLIAVLRKITRAGEGLAADDIRDPVDGVDDDGWTDVFAQARGDAERVWADDELLDRMVTLPWTTMPGRITLGVYTHEFTVHSWDLAHATGRLDALDPDLAERALDAFSKFAPLQERSEQGPFGPPVEVPDDADVYTRLAGYLGRQP